MFYPRADPDEDSDSGLDNEEISCPGLPTSAEKTQSTSAERTITEFCESVSVGCQTTSKTSSLSLISERDRYDQRVS